MPRPLQRLFALFALKDKQPRLAQQLNNFARHYDKSWTGPGFIDEGKADLTSCYYEVFIATQGQVPTRHHWHDTFNAFMWILFPHTKKLINTLHCEQIEQFGVHPRTPKRNRLTHFDECGLIIAVPEDKLADGNRLLNLLATHQWQQVFIENKEAWGKTLFPMIIGHALYEMLLDPFIGLTAKWLAVIVPTGFADLTANQQYEVVDKALEKRLKALEGLAEKHILKPVPLLGIPGWFNQQNDAFYANQNYFRPLAIDAPATLQLPLTIDTVK